MVRPHECAAPHRGEEIVCAAGKPAEAESKRLRDNNQTEATALSNTAISTGVITITCAEYGVAVEVTDNVSEDSVDGIDFLNRIEQRQLHVLSLAMEDDFLDLIGAFSNTVGTTTVDLSIANLLQAQQGLRTRGVNADALVYILDNQQAADAESAFTATNAAAAIYAQAVDRVVNWTPVAGHGMTTRNISTFRGFPVFTTGLTDTANGGADVEGCCMVPSTPYNDGAGHVAIGMAWKRLPRFEMDRSAKGRSTDLVMTCRAGFAELLDGAGSSLITDA